MKIRRKFFPEHILDLKKSGIFAPLAVSEKLYSVGRDKLIELLGFTPHPAVESGLVFPYSDNFLRVKIFPAYPDKNGKLTKYLQRKDSGSKFYIPRGIQPGLLENSAQPLIIAEGEKKVLAAIEKGLKNTIGIAGVWNGIKDQQPIKDFSLVEWAGRQVLYAPDSDVWNESKRDLLKPVFAFCREMEELGAEVKIAILPTQRYEIKIGLDDYLLKKSLDDFKALETIDLSDEIFIGLEDWYVGWKNKSEKIKKPQIPLNTLIYPALSSTKEWPKSPPLDAYFGLAGDFVRLIDPATEADPIALYVQFLEFFGNIVGRTAHFIAEQDKHYMNLFVVLVGETAKGRKGSSFSQVKNIFSFFDDKWFQEHVSSGLSSGEGLIWAVRDPVTRTEPVKEKGRVTSYQEIITDKGIADKRLIVYEPEFASALRVFEREGNTLSTQIRQAWETGTLRILTKNSPAKATDAHISIIGHITRDELRRYLSHTEAASGFGNRFLWLCVRRSKCLPEGGSCDSIKILGLMKRLKEAVRFASKVNAMRRSAKAREFWKKIYGELSEGRAGMVGAITARAEAQVMRLSCIFALLDKSAVVRTKHLKAAVDLWDYADRSAQHIFGKSIGDEVADKIHSELTNRLPEGMTLSEISALFSNHKGKERIQSAIQALLSLGLISWEERKTGGRHKRVFKAILK